MKKEEVKIVWSDTLGDLRKSDKKIAAKPVNTQDLVIQVRRLTAGKGRTVIELKNLPNNVDWCKKLEKGLKSKLGVGGTYKNGSIEIHGEKMELVTAYLDSQNLKWKKSGG